MQRGKGDLLGNSPHSDGVDLELAPVDNGADLGPPTLTQDPTASSLQVVVEAVPTVTSAHETLVAPVAVITSQQKLALREQIKAVLLKHDSQISYSDACQVLEVLPTLPTPSVHPSFFAGLAALSVAVEDRFDIFNRLSLTMDTAMSLGNTMFAYFAAWHIVDAILQIDHTSLQGLSLEKHYTLAETCRQKIVELKAVLGIQLKDVEEKEIKPDKELTTATSPRKSYFFGASLTAAAGGIGYLIGYPGVITKIGATTWSLFSACRSRKLADKQTDKINELEVKILGFMRTAQALRGRLKDRIIEKSPRFAEELFDAGLMRRRNVQRPR